MPSKISTHKISLYEFCLFLFRPSDFAIQAAKLHDNVEPYDETNEKFKLACESNSKRIYALRTSFKKTLVRVLMSAFVAYIFSQATKLHFAFNYLVVVKYGQASGAFLILIATLWQIDFPNRTFGGISLPEQAHNFALRILSSLGTFLYFYAYFL